MVTEASSTKNSSDIRSLIMNQIRSSLAPNRLVCSTRNWFYRPAGCGLMLSAVLVLVACVSVRVEPLTHESYPAAREWRTSAMAGDRAWLSTH